jgi:hypothetical protein
VAMLVAVGDPRGRVPRARCRPRPQLSPCGLLRKLRGQRPVKDMEGIPPCVP